MSETNSPTITWSADDLAAWNRLHRRAKNALVFKYGEGNVPPLHQLDLAKLEATAPRWGLVLSNMVREAIGGNVTPPPVRMALDETERAMVLEHRARTATTRAYNEGVEAAASLIENHTPESGQFRMSVLASAVRALLRKV